MALKTIILEDELTVFHMDSAKKSINEAMKETSEIELNFEKVDFVDSNGIKLLVNTARKLKKNGGRLILTNVKANVRELFDYVSLNEFCFIEG